MLRLLIVSTLLVAANSDVNELLGKWVAVVTYPIRGSFEPECPRFNLTKEDSPKCTCGDKGDTPVLKLVNPSEPPSPGLPSIYVTDSKEVASSLKIQCSCNDKSTSPLAVQKLNEKYFALYAGNPEKADEHATTVFAKTLPKFSELQAFLNSVPNLRDQAPAYLCKQSDFA